VFDLPQQSVPRGLARRPEHRHSHTAAALHFPHSRSRHMLSPARTLSRSRYITIHHDTSHERICNSAPEPTEATSTPHPITQGVPIPNSSPHPPAPFFTTTNFPPEPSSGSMAPIHPYTYVLLTGTSSHHAYCSPLEALTLITVPPVLASIAPNSLVVQHTNTPPHLAPSHLKARVASVGSPTLPRTF